MCYDSRVSQSASILNSFRIIGDLAELSLSFGSFGAEKHGDERLRLDDTRGGDVIQSKSAAPECLWKSGL